MNLTKADRLIKLYKSRRSFYYFVSEIFSQSKSLFPNGFVDGQYVKNVCELMQNNKKTARIGPREHLKSTAEYAHFMWQIVKRFNTGLEAHFFSFQDQMAAYHVGKIKQAVETNPFFFDLIDKKSTAEGVINFTWDGVHNITLVPHGMLGFKRGIHAPIIYVDDPFQDPSSKIAPALVKKVNDIFTSQIMDMTQDELHVCGTPQTPKDFFFDKKIMNRFAVSITPAIVDEANKIALWPEWMNWDELMHRRLEKGERIFRQEYLCSPASTENAYITKDRLDKVVNPKLVNFDMKRERPTENDVFAGYDIGKKGHPAHLAVFEQVKHKRIMVYQKFFDGWDYNKQIEFLGQAIKKLHIDRLWYDNTRGEFEGFEENGQLPEEMIPVVFSLKTKNKMAAEFDKAISKNEIELLNDNRMLEQIQLVDNDLKAVETSEGHGDSFWSICLSYGDVLEPQPELSIF